MHRHLIIAISLVAALASRAAPAASLADQRVAVLEFRLGQDVDVRAPEAFSDECRGAVVRATRKLGTLVLTRENMLEVLKATGGKCEEGQCEVETARNLNVAYFLTGDISRLANQYLITLKAFDTRKGALLGTQSARAPDEMALFDKLQPATLALLDEAFAVEQQRAGAQVVSEGASRPSPDVRPTPSAASPSAASPSAASPSAASPSAASPTAAPPIAAPPTAAPPTAAPSIESPSTAAEAVSAGAANPARADDAAPDAGLPLPVVAGGATAATGVIAAAVGAVFLMQANQTLESADASAADKTAAVDTQLGGAVALIAGAVMGVIGGGVMGYDLVAADGT